MLGAGGVLAGPPSGVSVGASTDKLGTIDLPSGMRVVIEEDHSKPVVALVAVINAGAAEDPVGKEGLAHLVEHLTFRAKPDGKIRRGNQLDFAGAASWNGSTTHDLTSFMVVGPKEALRNLLIIEGGRLMGPLAGLDERAFQIERDVVKNELDDRDEQGQLSAAEARLFEALYPDGHRYHRPVKGTTASVSALTLADAQAFVQQHYVPSNVTLYVAGDLDLATIHQLFGATLPEHFAVAPPTGAVAVPLRLGKDAPVLPNVPAAGHVQTVKAPAPGPMLYIGWSLPRGYAAEGVLERAIRSALEAVPVWASTNSDIQSVRATLIEGRDNSTLLCAVSLKEGRNPEKSLERVLDQLHRFSDPSAPSGSRNSEDTANRLNSSMGGGGARTLVAPSSMTVSPGLTQASQNNGGDPALSTQTRSRPDLDTPADVQVKRFQMTAIVDDVVETESVLARAEDRATLAHYTGDSSAWDKDMTALTDLGPSKWLNSSLKWLSRDRARAVFVDANGASVKLIENSGPPPVFAADDVRAKMASGALKTYAHGPVGDIQLLTLKNGLQVMLARRPGAPSVAATVGVRGGSATAEPLGSVPLAVRLARPTQVGNGPASQFGGSVTFRAGPDATYLEGRAASGNLENLLAVLSDTVQSLDVDGDLKWTWDDLVDAKRRYDASPSAQAERRFVAEIYAGTSMSRTAVADNLKQLGPGDLQRWINRTFRPRNAVLGVVGDIDVKEAEKLVREWFDGWSGVQDPKAEARFGKLTERIGPVRVVAIERPGAEATEIRVGCSVEPQSQTDLIALEMVGTRLRTKLGTLARSTLGGSDGFSGGANSQRQAAKLDVAGLVDARALISVLGTARKELSALADLKLTEDELTLLKWRQGIAWNGGYTSNAELARGLVWTRLADLPVDLIQKYPDLLGAVTAEDVTRVAGACRKTAVLLLSGDPAVVDKALLATESSETLRQGS